MAINTEENGFINRDKEVVNELKDKKKRIDVRHAHNDVLKLSMKVYNHKNDLIENK